MDEPEGRPYIDLQEWLRRKGQREAEARRFIELVRKAQREGHQVLTDEQRRFLRRFADDNR
jgi:hypothetical protein